MIHCISSLIPAEGLRVAAREGLDQLNFYFGGLQDLRNVNYTASALTHHLDDDDNFLLLLLHGLLVVSGPAYG